MLIYFSVAGFLSIKEPVEMYFVPSDHARIKNTRYESNFIFTDKYKVMKSAVIFGGNASGKTNILTAMQRLQQIVMNDLNLQNLSKEQLANFNYGSRNIVFKINVYSDKTNSEYEYSLEYSREKVIAESLKCNNTVVFDFKKDKLTINVNNQQKENLEKLFSVEATETLLRKLSDFLVEEIKDFKDLVKDLRISINDCVPSIRRTHIFLVHDRDKQYWNERKEKIVALLQLLDRTIVDFTFKPLGQKENELVLKRRQCKFIYHLGIESTGIKKLITYLQDFLDTFEHGKTLVMDELDSSISTKTLLELFNSFINTGQNKGQVIVTSHNIFLLNSQMFHPEQLFLVDKNAAMSTEVSSVGDFDLRSEKRKLYDDYIKGKLGGING